MKVKVNAVVKVKPGKINHRLTYMNLPDVQPYYLELIIKGKLLELYGEYRFMKIESFEMEIIDK